MRRIKKQGSEWILSLQTGDSLREVEQEISAYGFQGRLIKKSPFFTRQYVLVTHIQYIAQIARLYDTNRSKSVGDRHRSFATRAQQKAVLTLVVVAVCCTALFWRPATCMDRFNKVWSGGVKLFEGLRMLLRFDLIGRQS